MGKPKTQIYMIPGQTEYVPYEKTVIEKRAPTDESIKLYEEMKEKAYDSILDTLVVQDNDINLKAIIFREILSLTVKCNYKIVLNGKEIKGTVVCNDSINHRPTIDEKRKIFTMILEKISRNIAIELIKSAKIEF